MKILFIMVASVYEALEKGNKTDLIGVCLLIGIILLGALSAVCLIVEWLYVTVVLPLI